MEIIYVCTANVNRSVMAAALTGRAGHQRGLDLRVGSASIMDRPGHPSPAHTLAALLDVGIDAGAHRSRTLTAAIVEQADLVLTMERAHLRAAAVLAPGAFAKTFTLKEFLRRGLDCEPRPHHEPLAGYLARLGAGRQPQALLDDDTRDDVDDPQGHPRAAFQRTVEELDLLTQGVLYLLYGAR